MNKDDIADLVQNFSEYGLRLLEEDGNLPATIYVQTAEEGLIALPLSFLDHPNKDQYFDFYGKIAEAYDAKYYVVMLEAWKGRLSAEQKKKGVRVRDLNNKKECANFFFVTPDTTVLCSFTFYRDLAGKVIFICEPEVIDIPFSQRYLDPTLRLLDHATMSAEEKRQIKQLLPAKAAKDIAVKNIADAH